MKQSMHPPQSGMKNKQVSLTTTIILIVIAVFITAQLTWAVGFIQRRNYLRNELGDQIRLVEIRQLIDRYFVGEFDPNQLDQHLINEIFNGIGDRYGQYMTGDEFNEMMEQRTGSFVGIGVSVSTSDDIITITDVNDDGPAMRAGIIRGDIIYAVDGVDVSQVGVDSTLRNIRGEEGSVVTLTILREDRQIEISVTRGQVTMHPVVYAMAPDGETGIVRIRTFANNYLADRFAEALEDLKEQGATRFLFDLRYNGGGALDALVEVMRMLLPEGPIISIRFGDGTDIVHTNETDADFDFPIVVLVNEFSASASELFAAALRDYDMAVIVGQTTFGKGSLQRYFRLSNGSFIRLTAGMYYPPSGEGYDGVGVIPSVLIESGEQPIVLGRIEPESDTKLYMALQQFAD